jgi:hypothetical protein
VNPSNILKEKRPRANPDWPKLMVVYEKEELPVIPGKQALTGLQPLDRVKILTSRFGRVYAKDKPKYTEDIVRKRVGQMVDVLCTVYRMQGRRSVCSCNHFISKMWDGTECYRSLYILQDMENYDPGSDKAVSGFLLVITWVDDCRYFGTTELVEEYEKAITDNCKCTMEDVSKEFVSIQLDQDINTHSFVSTQQDYWDKAVIRFKECFGGEKDLTSV